MEGHESRIWCKMAKTWRKMKIQQFVSVEWLIVSLDITTPYFWWNRTFQICSPVNNCIYTNRFSLNTRYLMKANFAKIRFREISKNQRLAKFAKISPREICENFFIREIREIKLPRKYMKSSIAKINPREILFSRKFVHANFSTFKVNKKTCMPCL